MLDLKIIYKCHIKLQLPEDQIINLILIILGVPISYRRREDIAYLKFKKSEIRLSYWIHWKSVMDCRTRLDIKVTEETFHKIINYVQK